MTVACLRGLYESCHYHILTSQTEKVASSKVVKMKRMDVSQEKILWELHQTRRGCTKEITLHPNINKIKCKGKHGEWVSSMELDLLSKLCFMFVHWILKGLLQTKLYFSQLWHSKCNATTRSGFPWSVFLCCCYYRVSS